MQNTSINPFLKTMIKELNIEMFYKFLERTENVLELCKNEHDEIEFNPLIIILQARREILYTSQHDSDELKLKKQKIKYETMKMLKSILDKNFDPYYVVEKESRNLTGYNALHTAAEFKDSKAIGVLLKYSNKGINNITPSQKTALGNIISYMGTTFGLNTPPLGLSYLLKFGANIDDPAFLKNLYSLFNKSDGQKNNKEWIKVLQENNFKMDRPLVNGLSLLHLFTKHKQLDALKILWKSGYDYTGIPENCNVSIESVIHPSFKDVFVKEYVKYQKENLDIAIHDEINKNSVIHKKNRL